MSDSGDKIPPGAVFYVQMLVWNADGTMDLNAEAVTGGLKIKDALDPLMSGIEEYGGCGYVYECRPIMKVVQPDLKIIDFRKKTKP